MKYIIALIATVGFLNAAFSEETAAEKGKVQADNVQRETKKVIHRVGEAACGTLTGDNKVQCLAKKAKNRVIEGKDVVVDKTSEIKNKADTDSN